MSSVTEPQPVIVPPPSKLSGSLAALVLGTILIIAALGRSLRVLIARTNQLFAEAAA